MSSSWAVRLVLVASVCTIAALAALVHPGNAGSTAPASPAVPMSTVAGTLSTRVVIKRFRAFGRKVVGEGSAVSTFTDANGVKTVTRKHFWLRIRSKRMHQVQQTATVCQVLFLELGQVDLTLAGLHAFLRAADPTQPIQLRLTADDEGGILGRLFCQIAQAHATFGSHGKAVRMAKQMTRHLRGTSILRARATIYAPNQKTGDSAGLSPLQTTDECPVLHLILGPVHLDLLGLIVDLNQIALDVTAIPGTLLGDIFCQLASGGGSPAHARAG